MEEYCMYLRKSRADLEAEQRGEGETLARHKQQLLALAESLRLPITRIYQEIVSGERLSDRPEVLRLLQDVEEGRWSGVLVMEVERLARGDTMDQGIVAQAFKASSTRIITPAKTYDPCNEWDEEYFEFGLFMARREYKTITRRLQRGRIASVKEGNYVGSRPPYGYERVRNAASDGFTLVPHPEQGPVVQLIFNMYVRQGFGTSTIAHKLNGMKAPTANGSLWTAATLNGILRNPVYIGHVRWNSRPEVRTKASRTRPRLPRSQWLEVGGKHEPLIDAAVFDRAQDILAAKGRSPVPKGRITNPLAGLVRCGICGRAMVYRPYSRQPPHLLCSNPMCANKSSRFTYVEEAILGALREWLAGYPAQFGRFPSSEAAQAAELPVKLQTLLHQLEREHRHLAGQKERLHDLLERGVYTEEVYEERSRNLDERSAELGRAIMAAREELAQAGQRAEEGPENLPPINQVLDLYDWTKDPAKKNSLLRSVLHHAVYRKEKHQRLNDFTLTLYPKLPSPARY